MYDIYLLTMEIFYHQTFVRKINIMLISCRSHRFIAYVEIDFFKFRASSI